MADGSLFSQSDSVKCWQCECVKPVADFTTIHGKHTRLCRECNKLKSRAWRRNNPEKYRAYRAARREQDREINRVRSLAHYHKDIALSRDRQTANAYGLTVEAFRDLRSRLGNHCALCAKPAEKGRGGRLFVDHCHDTGRIRGFLCMACNSALGVLGDTPESIEKVLSYVRGAVEA